MGYRGETDLGHDLTGFGHLEFQIDAEDSKADENGVRETFNIRLGFVGLKGEFGKILIDQNYHTFYNFAVAPVDIPWWNVGLNMLNNGGRTEDGLTYEKNFGKFASVQQRI